MASNQIPPFSSFLVTVLVTVRPRFFGYGCQYASITNDFIANGLIPCIHRGSLVVCHSCSLSVLGAAGRPSDPRVLDEKDPDTKTGVVGLVGMIVLLFFRICRYLAIIARESPHQGGSHGLYEVFARGPVGADQRFASRQSRRCGPHGR